MVQLNLSSIQICITTAVERAHVTRDFGHLVLTVAIGPYKRDFTVDFFFLKRHCLFVRLSVEMFWVKIKLDKEYTWVSSIP